MARFFASIKGSAGEVTRLGTKSSGITSSVNGWDLGALVTMRVNDDGFDELIIKATGGSNNPDDTQLVYYDESGRKHLLEPEAEIRIVLTKLNKINLSTDW